MNWELLNKINDVCVMITTKNIAELGVALVVILIAFFGFEFHKRPPF